MMQDIVSYLIEIIYISSMLSQEMMVVSNGQNWAPAAPDIAGHIASTSSNVIWD